MLPIGDSRSGAPLLGASGAIAGVLGAYFLLFPRGRSEVLMGFFMAAMPALVVIGFWILLQWFIEIGAVDSAAGAGGMA